MFAPADRFGCNLAEAAVLLDTGDRFLYQDRLAFVVAAAAFVVVVVAAAAAAAVAVAFH